MSPNHFGNVVEENFHGIMKTKEIMHFEMGGKYTTDCYRITTFPSA